MADKKISALTGASTPLDGTEVLPIVKSGSTVKVANNDLRPKQIQANATSGVLQVTGPADASTRIMTTPDANFTVARTDAGQTFTGNQQINGTLGVKSTGGIVNVETTTARGSGSNYVTFKDPSGEKGYVGYISGANDGMYLFNLVNAPVLVGVNSSTTWTFTTAGNLAVATSGNGVTSGNFSLGLGANGNTSAVLIDTSGNLLVGYASGANHYIGKAVAEGSDILGVLSTTTNLQTAYFMGVSSAGENAAASAIGVRKNSSTSRSINAAGTINASGADYAEYMTKAGDFTIAKGDVVGIDAQGTLTNVFADAISFVVKSTDPSYVGGDVWGNEDALGLTKPQLPIRVLDETEQRLISEATEDKRAVYETVITKAGDSDEMWATKEAQYTAERDAFDSALEAARQRVDRIAFSGQVPVNVLGATAGQYIVPVNDNGAIKGEAVSNPTFEQYQISVGKVISIESDGRAKIIVKVA